MFVNENYLTGFFVLILCIIAYKRTKLIITQWKIISKNNKMVKEKREEFEKMKENGELPKWIQLPLPGGSTHVCEKTGYCPKVDGFVPKEYIQMYKQKLKTEEEYKEYRDKRIEQLAVDHNMTIKEMEKLAESIFSIKKQFHLDKMMDAIKDLENKSGKKIKVITDLNEMKEAVEELNKNDKVH